MGNASNAGGSAFKNVLAIDDGTASAISVSLTNLSLTSNSSLGTNELFVGTNDTMTFTGNITRGAGTTATTLTKTGTGRLVFSGSTASTYTDATVVSAGTLVLSSAANVNTTSGVTVAAGATFTNNSSASFTKNLILTEGAGAAGSTINGSGTFAAGNMTISSDLSDGFTSFALGSATLTKGGRLDLNLTNTTSGNYTLFSGGTINGVFGSFYINGFALTQSGNNFIGNDGSFDYTFTNSSNLLNVVPEPTTWALLAGGLTFVIVLRRRRAKI
jgi:autotransporter-associated beta strand protein